MECSVSSRNNISQYSVSTSGTLWSSCGGVGGSTGVVVPEVVTPVTIELLLGMWTI